MSLPHTKAEWPKKCPGCGSQIDEGDDIYLLDDDWVCWGCADAAGGLDE